MSYSNRFGSYIIGLSADKAKLDQNFWQSVEFIPFHSCWEWTGLIDEKGYGRFHLGNNKYAKAHRYSFLLKNKIDQGFVIDHICRNRACVNPEHLRQATPRQNAIENSISITAMNSKKTHCKHGHEFTIENTIIRPRRDVITRGCRACKKLSRKPRRCP